MVVNHLSLCHRQPSDICVANNEDTPMKSRECTSKLKRTNKAKLTAGVLVQAFGDILQLFPLTHAGTVLPPCARNINRTAIKLNPLYTIEFYQELELMGNLYGEYNTGYVRTLPAGTPSQTHYLCCDEEVGLQTRAAIYVQEDGEGGATGGGLCAVSEGET
ncbi:hypothetical protein CBL_06511 [Carabus blaptoides fortunei]